MSEKWEVQKSEDDSGQQPIADAQAPPVEWYQHDGKKFYGYRQGKRDRGDCPPTAAQRSHGHQQQQHAQNIDVAAARIHREQRVPGVGEHPVFCLAAMTQYAQQHENNGEITNSKCNVERED